MAPTRPGIHQTLLEALPYIREFHGRTVVIKYGGAAMTDESLRDEFANDVVLLKYVGLNPVIVHGGGPQIGLTLKRLGKESTFVDGLRVTDDETMEVVEMVLGGKVNREIVALIQRGGGRAVGLTGSDGDMIRVTQRLEDDRDLGRVGRVVEVDPAPIVAVTEAGFVPVIAPIGIDAERVTHNVNADEAAGAIAAELAIPPTTLSFHLTQLVHAGLATARRRGRSIIYAAGYGAIDDLLRFLIEDCCQGKGAMAEACLASRNCPTSAKEPDHETPAY